MNILVANPAVAAPKRKSTKRNSRYKLDTKQHSYGQPKPEPKSYVKIWFATTKTIACGLLFTSSKVCVEPQKVYRRDALAFGAKAKRESKYASQNSTERVEAWSA